VTNLIALDTRLRQLADDLNHALIEHILTDLRGAFAGNLALFTVDADKSAHGRFLAETVRFMPLRSPEQPFQLLPELSARAVSTPGEHRTTSLDPSMLRDRTFAFFAQLAMPGTEAGHVVDKDDPNGPTVYFCLTDPQQPGWARVEPRARPPIAWSRKGACGTCGTSWKAP
jgi:hypothetical protein